MIILKFQSSFELMGYITMYYFQESDFAEDVSKLFRAYGLYNMITHELIVNLEKGFKALSSLWVI